MSTQRTGLFRTRLAVDGEAHRGDPVPHRAAIAVPWDSRPARAALSWDRRPACPALACPKGDADERAVVKQTIAGRPLLHLEPQPPIRCERLHADPDLHRRDTEPGAGADGRVLPARASRDSRRSANHGRNRVPRCGEHCGTGGTPVLRWGKRCAEQDRQGARRLAAGSAGRPATRRGGRTRS